jgi:hypothetical protein
MPADKFRKAAQQQENIAATARIQRVAENRTDEKYSSQKVPLHISTSVSRHRLSFPCG